MRSLANPITALGSCFLGCIGRSFASAPSSSGSMFSIVKRSNVAHQHISQSAWKMLRTFLESAKQSVYFPFDNRQEAAASILERNSVFSRGRLRLNRITLDAGASEHDGAHPKKVLHAAAKCGRAGKRLESDQSTLKVSAWAVNRLNNPAVPSKSFSSGFSFGYSCNRSHGTVLIAVGLQQSPSSLIRLWSGVPEAPPAGRSWHSEFPPE